MVFSSRSDGRPGNLSAVSEQALRDLFNRNRIAERAAAGEFTVERKSDRQPTATATHERLCTRSQTLRYRDQHGKQLAIVHQYLRTNGTLGASGKPDPKVAPTGKRHLRISPNPPAVAPPQ